MALIKIGIFSFDLLPVKFVYICIHSNSHNETDIILEDKLNREV